MKKLLLMLLLSITIFASNDFLEDKLETKAQINKIIEIQNLKNYEVDYDIKISGKQMAFEIEIESLKQPKLDYEEVVKKILTLVKEEVKEVEEVYVVITYDSISGENEVLFADTRYF